MSSTASRSYTAPSPTCPTHARARETAQKKSEARWDNKVLKEDVGSPPENRRSRKKMGANNSAGGRSAGRKINFPSGRIFYVRNGGKTHHPAETGGAMFSIPLKGGVLSPLDVEAVSVVALVLRQGKTDSRRGHASLPEVVSSELRLSSVRGA